MSIDPLTRQARIEAERALNRLIPLLPSTARVHEDYNIIRAVLRAATPDALIRTQYESQRHFFEPPDGDDVCTVCGEFRDQDFVRITVHYNDGDG